MLTFTSRNRGRSAVFGALALIGTAAAIFASSAAPAAALCKYGTPHCVNKNPGPKPPAVPNIRIPDSNWRDPDCKYYGNCH